MVSWAPRLPPAVSGSGARCGRVCWAWVSPVPSLSWLGCRGVFFFFFLRFGFFFSFFFFFLGFVVPVPPSPILRAGLVALFFFFFFFFPCPFSPWSAVTGLVLPVLGGWFPCASAGVPLFFFFFFFWGGGLDAFGGVGGWLGGCGLFSCLFPFPPPFFLGGGGLACSSLCLPWAGARTGLYSVLSSGLLSSVAFCVAMFRPHGSGGLCTRWARRPLLLG